MSLTKEDAHVLFDRLEEAGLHVSLRRYGEYVDVTRLGHEPERTEGERGYEVEVEVESLDAPDLLRLLADQVDKRGARIVASVTSLKVR